MLRVIARPFGILALILAVMLATLASPALAGDLGGGSFSLALYLENPALSIGSCAYMQSTTSGHFFIGIKTSVGIKIVGPIDGSLPEAFGNDCTFLGTF